jgi:hypothetical protein
LRGDLGDELLGILLLLERLAAFTMKLSQTSRLQLATDQKQLFHSPQL